MTRNRNPSETKEKSYCRLPKCVIPVHYNLTFEPSQDETILYGQMSIRVEVKCDTKEIILNGLNINVSKAKFTVEETNEDLEAKDILVQNDKEIIQIEFPTTLKPGFGSLYLDFDAQINQHMKGVFRSKVTGADGNPRNNLITHFEPVSARRCFPGFDEPEFKASFGITLIVQKNLVAISNMPLKEEHPYEKNEALRVCVFETTPKMSTYLIAFVIGEFDVVKTKDEDGVLIRVFTPLGKQNQGEFAADLASKALPYYKKYFGIPYPLAKCDLVASPDFEIGAMENYGIVIFRDIRLLVDPQETSSISKQYTSLIICHELAHKWFGNLVTMKWWCDLWLKEGFANFIENLCVDNFFPEMDVWTQFVTDNTLCAMSTADNLKNSHPIEVPVTDPSQIDEIFDNITYNKGSSIIRMMYNYIGDETFRKGMNKYLIRFQYSNAETIDLWDALGESSGQPVGKMMDTFTKQMGFPLITVVKAEQDLDTASRVFTLKQEKFWSDPKLYGKEHSDMNAQYKWIVPLTFSIGSKDKPKSLPFKFLFDGNTGDAIVTVPDVNPGDWVKINSEFVGYYRVRYPPEILSEFKEAIQNKTLPPADRAGLLNDLHATIKNGQSSATDIFNLLKAYTNDDNFVVWSTIRDIMIDFHTLLIRTDLSEKFKAYGISVFKPLMERVGWEPKPNEGHMDTLLRALVINRMISFGDKETVDEAKRRFALHLTGENKIPADLRVSVYKAFLSDGDKDALELMLNIYRESEMSEEKVRILHSLGAISNKHLLQNILDFAISDEVPSSMLNSVLYSLTLSKEGQDLIWKFFKENVKLFQEKFPGGFNLGRSVELTTENFTTEEMATEVEAFFRENPCRGTERTVQQAVENIRINAAWLARDQQCISTYLN